MTHPNKDNQAERAAGVTDAEIAGIMGWRGPGAYTEATFRKIKRIIEADRLARQDQQPARASVATEKFYDLLCAYARSQEHGSITGDEEENLIAHINAWGGVTEDHTKPEK